MYQLLRHRRALIVIAACSILILLLYGRSWLSQDSELDNSFPEDSNLDALFGSTNELQQLYDSEPKAHEHSVKWSNEDGIPETQIYAHIPGK